MFVLGMIAGGMIGCTMGIAIMAALFIGREADQRNEAARRREGPTPATEAWRA